MFDHAEIKRISPDDLKAQIKKRAQPAQPSVATPGYVPNTSMMSESPSQTTDHNQVGIPRKLTLYDELISSNSNPLPKDFVEQLMQIIINAAATPVVTIKPEQLAALRKKLKQETEPTSKADVYSRDLLAILFNEIMRIQISLEPAFVNEIKQGCKAYVKRLNGNQLDTPVTVQLFLKQWAPLIFDRNFDMNQGAPTNYQYDNIESVMPLLSRDQVSTTDDPKAIEKRRSAAALILDQIGSPLTFKQLRQILLNLNEIYSPQDEKPYKQGFRYHHAKIGQERDAIGTTPAMEVENSVEEVIKQITTTLEACESQYKEGTISLDDMLKTVIATSAMAYQLLISIHPFADGNGRTCRMFANYILMRYHLLPATFSTGSAKLSMYDDKNRFEESNTEFPQKARTAMIGALAASYNLLHPQ